MSRDSGAYVPNSAHAPNFGSRFRNRSETKIPPYPSDFVGIYASVLFLHLEQKKFKQIYEKYQNKKFRSNIGISAVSSDIERRKKRWFGNEYTFKNPYKSAVRNQMITKTQTSAVWRT